MREDKLDELVENLVKHKSWWGGNDIAISPSSVYTFVEFKGSNFMALEKSTGNLLVVNRGDIGKVAVNKILKHIYKRNGITNGRTVTGIFSREWKDMSNITNPFGITSDIWESLDTPLQQKLLKRMSK